MGQGAGPCPGLLAFPHTSAPSKAMVVEGKQPWGGMHGHRAALLRRALGAAGVTHFIGLGHLVGSN